MNRLRQCAFLMLYLVPCLAHGSLCLWGRYPSTEPFDPDEYTFPNSVCIYPDGRSSLADAVFGNLEMFLGLALYHYDSGWYIYDYPEQGLLLGDSGSNLIVCDNSIPYVYTNEDYTTFGYQPIFGGGHSEVDVDGKPISSSYLYWAPDPECGIHSLELYFNSPDINGDLLVNLTDVVLFSQDMAGPYNYRSDFNFDNTVNLSDHVILVQAMGATCP
jgi:hypothetical protein